MTGKMLLRQLEHLKHKCHVRWETIDDPAVKKLAEDCKIPVEYHGVFEAYCVDFLLEHEVVLKRIGDILGRRQSPMTK